MADMARSVRPFRPLTRLYPAHPLHQSPPDSHDSPYPFYKIRPCPYGLIAVLQCREKVYHLSFQVTHNGMYYLVEGIVRSGIDVQVQVV